MSDETPNPAPAQEILVSLAELEAAHIKRVLAASPSMTVAAAILGIDMATLYRKRLRLGLPVKHWRFQ